MKNFPINDKPKYCVVKMNSNQSLVTSYYFIYLKVNRNRRPESGTEDHNNVINDE